MTTALTAVAFLTAGHIDLSSFATRRLAAATGRSVRIGSLHVTPGRWITVELDDAHLGNVRNGSRPDMISVGHLHTQVRLTSLLWGPVETRDLVLTGFSGLFERTPDHTPNWRFGASEPRKAQAAAPDQTWFPGLRQATIRDSEVVYRTARGHSYQVGLNDVTFTSANDDAPLLMSVTGSYNTTPVAIMARMQSISLLRVAGTPYGTAIHATSGDLTLDLESTITDLLDFDGVAGKLTLRTPSSAPLMAFAGEPASDFAMALGLDGHFVHRGNLWSLDHTTGHLGGNQITDADVVFTEGAKGAPDQIGGNVNFAAIDLNGLTGGGPSTQRHADISLAVPAKPDPVIDVRLGAKQVSYNDRTFSDVSVVVTQGPGRIDVKSLSLAWLGARLHASGSLAAAENGTNLRAAVDMSGADIDRFRRQAGLAEIPISGQLSFHATAAADNIHTLDEAEQVADLTAAVGMDSGAISRRVIAMASTDVSLLVRNESGMAPVSCLLGVLTMRHGMGTVVPLRVNSAAGTVIGAALFDLNRKWFDLAFQSRAPGFFALDVPIRVSGSFSHPGFGLAGWSAKGRDLLKNARAVSTLPAGIADFAPGKACLRITL
ncbi:AsmA family protein [Acetobacter musti]|uniref:AsmA family protein n=1 Tax=Acetobacter musti TaxID=864732 RepID=UPI0030D3B4CE